MDLSRPGPILTNIFSAKRRISWLELLLAAAPIAMGILARLAYGVQIRDDAYITLRYAENLASGLGFVYNPGEHVLGTTTPAFALLLALLARIGFDPVPASVAIGITADALTTLLLYRIVRQSLNPTYGRTMATGAAFAYALFSPVVAYGVSGLETPLYTLLILSSCMAFATGQKKLLVTLLAASILVRPDALLLVLVLGAFGLLASPKPRITDVLLFLALLAPWLIFATFYFGSPVPQSLTAKLDLALDDPLLSLKLFGAYFSDTGDRWFLLFTPLCFIGLLDCWRAGRAQRALLLWAAAYSVAFIAANKFVYPYWPFEWYFVPLLAPYALTVGYGLGRVRSFLRSQLLRPASAYVGVALLSGFMLALGAIAVGFRPVLERNVGGREGLYVELARELVDAGAVADVVAAPEIGTLGYFYRGNILDLHGLVSPQILGTDRTSLIQRNRPPWIVTWDTLLPSELTQQPWFDAEYRPVKILINWEGRKAIFFRRYPTPDSVRSRAARLGEALELLDSRISLQQLEGRRLLRVQVDWRISEPVKSRYTIFAHLVDRSGEIRSQQDNEPQEGTTRLDGLSVSEISDLYDLTVPADVDLSRAGLLIGAYETEAPSRHLRWRSPAGMDLGEALSLPLPFDPLQQTVLSGNGVFQKTGCADFEGSIRLLGYSLSLDEGSRELTLIWESSRQVSRDYTVFVHGLDGKGEIVAQTDGMPADGRFSTSMWLPGDVIVDRRALSQPAWTKAETVRVGLYDLSTSRRLPVGASASADSVDIDLSSRRCSAP